MEHLVRWSAEEGADAATAGHGVDARIGAGVTAEQAPAGGLARIEIGAERVELKVWQRFAAPDARDAFGGKPFEQGAVHIATELTA